MKFDKLFKCIGKLAPEYLDPIHRYINSFLQEIMDSENYYDNGASDISTEEILDNISENINYDTSNMLMICAIEFTITNRYPLYDEAWNCIEHFLNNHKSWFTAKDKEYLRALNNSYMSIYKVISTNPGTSIILQDQVTKKSPKITVLDKSLSNSVKINKYIACRIVKAESKVLLSASVLEIPKTIVKDCTNVIRNITEAIKSPLAMQAFSQDKSTSTKKAIDLQIKKMWTKEIVEAYYLYYSNPVSSDNYNSL
jgi:hypothetical protein